MESVDSPVVQIPVQTLEVTHGGGGAARDIAVRARHGKTPGLVWLGGYRSDMDGTKAIALDAHATERGLACCRHDYSGHGLSGGEFLEGTISRWVDESLTVFDTFCADGTHILVGSSMGAWIALRMVSLLQERGHAGRIGALLLLAPAPDFTEELMWPNFTQAQRDEIERTGRFEEASQYSDEPNIFTRALFEDGRNNRVMTGPLEIGCPVHIIQGADDPDVPSEHALKLASLMPQDRLTFTMVPDGDHRLSRPSDIDLIKRSVDALVDDAL